MPTETHPIRGILAGVLGGLIASWVMNEFIAGPGAKLQAALNTGEQNRQATQQAARLQASGEPTIDATMKAADAIVNTLSGGRHLSLEQKQRDGPIVHYSFGALTGGIYGGLAEYLPFVTSGFGTTFGGCLFAGADLVAVPALHLSGAPEDSPINSYANPLAAHLVYGATTELVRRLVRKVL